MQRKSDGTPSKNPPPGCRIFPEPGGFSHPDIVSPLSVEIFPIAASFRLLQRNDHVPGALRRHEVVFAIGGRKKA